MISRKWNEEWYYWKEKDSFALVWNISENARKVTLPHDAMIEDPAHENSKNGGNTGYRDGEVYTYVKMLYASEEDIDKTLSLKFEGVYMNAFVYVNEQLAAKSPFGYTTFYVNLDKYLVYGAENEIRVQVRAGAMSNSRWYSGGGIYRDVYLMEGPKTYICPDSVQIATVEADEAYGVLQLSVELHNRETYSKDLVLETQIVDGQGSVVATERSRCVLTEGEERILRQKICVEQPALWSDEQPNLYLCKNKLYEKSGEELQLLDESSETFGIRTIQLDAKRGLRVNGKVVKLRGACIHHDSGLLGAATYEDAQYRQIKYLKDAGFNSVRMAHQPMAPAMLRACDALGVYVMDEAFDMWNRLKSDYDYGLFFQEWWEADITAMVKKDFNHPSVIMYSIGNEIPEIGTTHGSKTCHELSDKVHALDHTRYVTAGINGVFAAGDGIGQIVDEVTEGNVNNFMAAMDAHMDEIVVHPIISERLEKGCEPLDICGYNYMAARYEKDGETYPNRVIVGSETYPPEIARNWELVERLPHVIGDFTWTGWDYIGEAGVGIPAYKWGEGGFGAVYPAQLAYCGDFDLTGMRRPASYLREIVFGRTDKPYIAVQNPNHYGEFLIKTPWVLSDATPCWTWKDSQGQPIVVEVYATGDQVELLLNGTSLGKRPCGKAHGCRALFETVYEPGVLTAVSYADGVEKGRTVLQTAGEQTQIVVTPDYEGKELIYLNVELQDAKGNLVMDAEQILQLQVEGDVQFMGFGSGNPKTPYNYTGLETETYLGRAQIILKKTAAVGLVSLTIAAQNDTKATFKIRFN